MRAAFGLIALFLASLSARAECAAPEIKMYGASWCGPCQAVKAYLSQQGVAYQYLDVDEPSNREAYKREGGGKGIPLLSINGDKILGANLPAIDAALRRVGAIKKPAPAPAVGGDLYGGQTAAWWQQQFRGLRSRVSSLDGQVANQSKSAQYVDEKQALEALKDDLKLAQASLDQLENEASRASVPRKFRE